VIAGDPLPEILARNGSYMAYRRLQEHRRRVSRFFCGSTGDTPEEQELIAAKLMGRWRSGAPLVLLARQRRSGSRRGHAAKQTTSTTRKWIRTDMRFRSARTRGG